MIGYLASYKISSLREYLQQLKYNLEIKRQTQRINFNRSGSKYSMHFNCSLSSQIFASLYAFQISLTFPHKIELIE